MLLCKWFGEMSSMQICGEHKESGILRHGFFASPASQDGPTDVELEFKGKYKGDLLLRVVDMFAIIHKRIPLWKYFMYAAFHYHVTEFYWNSWNGLILGLCLLLFNKWF